MNKLEVTKKVASVIVGLGTSKVTSDIIRNNAQPRHLIDQISIFAASLVVGSMAAEKTQEHTGVMIDEVATLVTKLKKN